VGHVARLAGVTVRTLHHYDEIGLVQPLARTTAGYRAYSAGDVERLRQVLAYRRLGFGLREIADLVGDTSADAAAHLHRLRGLLLEQRDRADAMVAAIDRELAARAEGMTMTPQEQLGMLGARLYDAIGGAYPATRGTEPRIAERIWDALGNAQTVLNVGAGTGSYEPPDRDVTAVEPSAVMRALRPPGSAPCVDAVAERLPFADRSFDAAMAVSTVHHWRDPIAGLREMRRVARRVVVLTFDADDGPRHHRFWLSLRLEWPSTFGPACRPRYPDDACCRRGTPVTPTRESARGTTCRRIRGLSLPGNAGRRHVLSGLPPHRSAPRPLHAG